MATINLGTSTSSTVIGLANVGSSDTNQFGTVAALAVMEPLTVIPAIENLLARAYETTGRVAKAQNRVEQPMVRFSLDEMHWYLDHAAREVAMRVRSEFLKGLQTTANPTSNAFGITDKLRVLGSRVKVNSAIAKKLGIYQFRDLTSRGITFTDTEPVWTFVGGELRVYGDTPTDPNPSDAEAAFISLPEIDTRTDATSTFNGTTGVSSPASTFVAARDTYLPILLDDGVDTAWAYIASVTDDQNIVLGVFEDLSLISTTTGALTITWDVPAYYMLPKIIENLVILLAAHDMLMAMGEFDLASEYNRQYNTALREFALPIYGLPLESEMNE